MAFQTRYDHFEYQVILFGLSNVPVSFQGYINKILAEKLGIFVIVYLEDILIYTKDPSQKHVKTVRWVLNIPRKNGLFANLKKRRFHKDEVQFLGYIVSSQGIWMEDKRIKVVKNWPEAKSVQDIQVFIGFTNFYWPFIRGFSKIAALLTSIFKTIGSSDLALRELGTDEIVRSGGKANDRNLSKKFKNAKSEIQMRVRTTEEPTFLTPGTKEVFNQLRQVFTKAPILWHFDPECHIRIETNTLGYAIEEVLSQLTFDHVTSDQGQWHPIAYFLRKIILAETRYKIHNGELLVIVKAFKTWKQYLEDCKHKVLVLINYNNLC